MDWPRLLIAMVVVAMLSAIAMLSGWFRRSAMSNAEAAAYLRVLGTELVLSPGRLRRVAADPRTPWWARWCSSRCGA